MSESVRQSMELRRNLKLDDWYIQTNRLYLNKNFDIDRFQIFAHLVEVVGGLSTLASDKHKPGTEAEKYIPKAIAWWLALCGKVGVRSVEQLIWWKFPGACPYCRKEVHDDALCQEAKARSVGPDWAELERLGGANASRQPHTLPEWQQMFRTIYPVQASSEPYYMTFARLTEELGELSEALRVQPVAPGYFFSEAADVFAWLMHLQNLYEARTGLKATDRCMMVAPTFAATYGEHCLDCRRSVCVCPSILPSTLGRIAHEVPEGRVESGINGPLLPFYDAVELFRTVEVSFADATITVRQDELESLSQAVTQLIRLTVDQGRDMGVQALTLMDALYELRSLTASQEITEAAVNRLIDAVNSLTPSERDSVHDELMAFVNGLASGSTIQLLTTIATAIASKA